MLGPTSIPKPVEPTIARQHSDLLARLPFSDNQDFEGANRGLLAPIVDPVVADDGTVLWDNSTYAFLAGEAPHSVTACGGSRGSMPSPSR